MASPSPPTPEYIFRGHSATINSLCFFDSDQHIVSGDANGVVIVWKVKTRRAVLQWSAHKDSCFFVGVYEKDKLLSQGRDDHVHVWQLPELAEEELLKEPACILSITYPSISFLKVSLHVHQGETLLCLPSGNASWVDVFNLTQQKRFLLRLDDGQKRGICMAARLIIPADGDALQTLVGYENGSVAMWAFDLPTAGDHCRLVWQMTEHREPVLDIAVHGNQSGWAISTAADNQIVKYALDGRVIQKITNKKSGLAAVSIREDGRVIATAGHDGRIRMFSGKNMKPLARLDYHRDSAYAVCFSCSVTNTVDHWLAGGGKDTRISLWKIY